MSTTHEQASKRHAGEVALGSGAFVSTSDSESLRAATARYRAHNDRQAPPMSGAERARGQLVEARRSLARAAQHAKAERIGACVGAMHRAIDSMLAVLEAQS